MLVSAARVLLVLMSVLSSLDSREGESRSAHMAKGVVVGRDKDRSSSTKECTNFIALNFTPLPPAAYQGSGIVTQSPALSNRPQVSVSLSYNINVHVHQRFPIPCLPFRFTRKKKSRGIFFQPFNHCFVKIVAPSSRRTLMPPHPSALPAPLF